jgi:hypothetical protein
MQTSIAILKLDSRQAGVRSERHRLLFRIVYQNIILSRQQNSHIQQPLQHAETELSRKRIHLSFESQCEVAEEGRDY